MRNSCSAPGNAEEWMTRRTKISWTSRKDPNLSLSFSLHSPRQTDFNTFREQLHISQFGAGWSVRTFRFSVSVSKCSLLKVITCLFFHPLLFKSNPCSRERKHKVTLLSKPHFRAKIAFSMTLCGAVMSHWTWESSSIHWLGLHWV